MAWHGMVRYGMMKVLLHEFDVPNAAFSADVLACLPPQGWAITEDLIGQ